MNTARPDFRERVYQAVVTLWQRGGLAPSIREVMREAGLHSTGSTNYHLEALIARGQLKRIGPPGASRSIVPTDLDPWIVGGLIVHLEHLCAGRDAVPVAELRRLLDGLAANEAAA